MSRINHIWNDDQSTFLEQHYQQMTDAQIAERLGLREGQVASRRSIMGLKKRWDAGTKARHDKRFFNVHEYRCWLTGERKRHSLRATS